jgi:hypothetical protein
MKAKEIMKQDLSPYHIFVKMQSCLDVFSVLLIVKKGYRGEKMSKKFFKSMLYGLFAMLLLTLCPLCADVEVLYSYDGLSTIEADGLQLSNFKIFGSLPWKAGDIVIVKFDLKNITHKTIYFGKHGIFVSCLEPNAVKANFGNQFRKYNLLAGKTVNFIATKKLDRTGPWTFWPAYHLGSAGWVSHRRGFGPHKWRAVKLDPSTKKSLPVRKIGVKPLDEKIIARERIRTEHELYIKKLEQIVESPIQGTKTTTVSVNRPRLNVGVRRDTAALRPDMLAVGFQGPRLRYVGFPLWSLDVRTWLLEFKLRFMDGAGGVDPADEFEPHTFAGGTRILNINDSKLLFVYYSGNLRWYPTLRYIRETRADGTGRDLDLSQSPDYFTIRSRMSNNRDLLQLFTFIPLDADKKPLYEPIRVLFCNLKRYHAVRTDIARMNKKYICDSSGNRQECINNFNYEEYILNHPNWLRALGYHNWSVEDKQRFYGFLKRLEEACFLDFDNNDNSHRENGWSVEVSEEKAKEISLLYAAHSLFMEVNGKLHWSIENMEAELLQTLFHYRCLFWERKSRGETYYATLHFIDTHPNNIDDWAVDNFMESTPGETIYKLDEWVGENIIHKSEDHAALAIQTFTNFNNSSPKVTYGCSATARCMASIARALNIPAIVIYVHHTALYFPSIGKGMAHADDPYDYPQLSLDSPFTENLLGLANACYYYNGRYSQPGEDSPEQNKQLYERFRKSYDTYKIKLKYLHITPDSSILSFTCRGYNMIKGFMDLYVNAYGEEAFKRLYCCTLPYLEEIPAHISTDCEDVDAETYNCTQLTRDPDACYDVKFLPAFRLNLFPKNSSEERKFLAGSEIPDDFLNELAINPNLTSPYGHEVFLLDNFKNINRFVLRIQADVLKSW